jgi:tripartite-type tricarboxylate transporter receptor subunit TctC
MTAFVKRRELLRGFAELPVASHIAVAETYPSRPLRILVATSAGGGTDRNVGFGRRIQLVGATPSNLTR